MKRKVMKTLSILLTLALISGMCITASAALPIQNAKFRVLDFDNKPASLPDNGIDKTNGILIRQQNDGTKPANTTIATDETNNKYLKYAGDGVTTLITVGGAGSDSTDTSLSIKDRARFGFDFMIPGDASTDQYNRAAYVYLGQRADASGQDQMVTQTDGSEPIKLQIGFTIMYASNANKFTVRCMKHDATTGKPGTFETDKDYATNKWYRFELAVNVPDKEVTYLIVDNKTHEAVYENTVAFPDWIEGFNNRYAIQPQARNGLQLRFDNMYSVVGETPQGGGDVTYGTSDIIKPITLKTDFSESFMQDLETDLLKVDNGGYFSKYNTLAFRNVGYTDGVRGKITNGDNGFGVYGNIKGEKSDTYLQIPKSSKVDLLLFNGSPGGFVYDKAIYEFDIKFDPDGENGNSWVKIGADRSDHTANVDLGFVARYNQGEIGLGCYGSSGETPLGNFATDKWYHFKMEYNAKTNKADYYVFNTFTGALLGSAKDIPIKNDFKQTLTLHAFALNLWGYCIDNYTVSKDTYTIDKSEMEIVDGQGYYTSKLKVANTGYAGAAKIAEEALNGVVGGPMCEVADYSPVYILATYDSDGSMVGASIAHVDDLPALTDATATPQTVDLTCSIIKTGEEKTIKGFVWDSLEYPMPYMDSLKWDLPK